ncbi:UNVERIFIED_CONTAM: hypothetical protein GTU68_007189 [Idotea baltica]|nr:hypothetical protein [Idotea baltica]
MLVFYTLIFYFGTYVSKKKSAGSVNDILLGGRTLPLGVAVFTMSATWIGGGYINGSAESTASFGLAWVQAPWGYALSLILGGLFFARKMRRFNFKTMLDPLHQRFGKKMTAVLFIPALMGEIFWTAAILTALGTTFGTVLGLDFNISIILSAIIAILYTVIGGLWAVALTDVLQLILLMLGLLIVLPFALDHVGGWSTAWTKKAWEHPEWGNFFWNWCDYALLLIFGGIPWQVYFQRVLSAKNEKTAMYLSFFAGFICLLAAIPPIMIGVIAHSADWVALGVAAPENASLTLPYVVRYMTNPFVATIGLGAIAAAVMSSADSSMLSAASMAGWNVFRPLADKNKVTDASIAKVVKASIWIVGIAATILALKIESIYTLWYLCSDLVYCILFPQLVCALFDKKANTTGSIIGFIVAVILRIGGGEPTLGIPIMIDYPMIEMVGDVPTVLFPFRTLAMICSLITIILVSRISQKRDPAKELVGMV